MEKNIIKNKKPYISVIIPVYNVEKYLKKCLDSVLDNTFKDLEVICVDDGSTDHSMDILKFYEKRDTRIKVLYQDRKGPAAARNKALDVAQGEYINFVDSDDFVSFNAYEIMAKVCKQYDLDIMIFGANAFPAQEAPEWIWNIINTRANFYKNCDGGKVVFDEKAARPFLWMHCLRRELLELPMKLRFDESMMLGEDQLFQFQYFLNAKNIMVIEDKLYNYRIARSGSLMQMYSSRKIKKVDIHLMLVQKLIDSWKENGAFKYQEDRLITWSINFLYFSIIDLPKNYQIKYAKKIIELLEKNKLHTYLIADYEMERFKELSEWSMIEIEDGNENMEMEILKQKIEREKYEIQETLKSRAFKLGRKFVKKQDRIDLKIFDEI